MSVCFGQEVSDDDQVSLGHGELLISYPEMLFSLLWCVLINSFKVLGFCFVSHIALSIRDVN